MEQKGSELEGRAGAEAQSRVWFCLGKNDKTMAERQQRLVTTARKDSVGRSVGRARGTSMKGSSEL